MMPVSSCTPPSSRVLTGWWEALASWEPGGLWFGEHIVHRLELCVRAGTSRPLDALAAYVLRRCAQLGPTGLPAHQLCRHDLPIPRVVHALLADRLLVESSVGGLTCTELGRNALQDSRYPQDNVMRSTCLVLDTRPTPASPPTAALLPTLVGQQLPWQEIATWPCSFAAVQQAVRADPGTHYLLPNVQELASFERSIVVVQTFSLTALTLRANSGALPTYCIFPVRPEGWSLHTTPAWQIPIDLSALCAPTANHDWQQAWADWCCEKGVSLAVAEHSKLTGSGPKLSVQLPRELADSLPEPVPSWLSIAHGRQQALGKLTCEQ